MTRREELGIAVVGAARGAASSNGGRKRVSPDSEVWPSVTVLQATDSILPLVTRAFPGLDEAQLRLFLALGRFVDIDKGVRYVAPGCKPPGLCVVESGCMVVEQDGHILREFLTGGYFGEGSLFRDDPPQVAIRARDPSRLLVIPY